MNSRILSASVIGGVAAIAGIGTMLAGVASAQDAASTTSTASSTSTGFHREGGMRVPGVFGKITAINGTTLTVVDDRDSAKTYTVDASAAKVLKSTAEGTAPTTVTLSDLALSDMVAIRGTVSGTSVTATEIMDGPFGGHMGGPGMGKRGKEGTVSAVNGNTITLTGSDGTTYTVDASNAKVSKTTQINVSDITIGDTLMVQGSVSGTSVTAVHIMDGLPPRDANAPPQN